MTVYLIKSASFLYLIKVDKDILKIPYKVQKEKKQIHAFRSQDYKYPWGLVTRRAPEEDF